MIINKILNKKLVLIFAFTLLGGCNIDEMTRLLSPPKEVAKAPPAMPPTEVTIVKVNARNVPVNFEYIGQVAGSLEVDVRARITGIIEKRLFTEGKAVVSGEVLFELDPKLFTAQLEQAKASLALAKASKSSAVAQLKKAERDFARIAPLSSKKLVSRSERDNAESSIELAKAAIQQAEATILQAKASIITAQVNLDYTIVKAPISGIVGRVLKNEGSLAEAGSNSLLTTIAQINPAYINFGIAESEQIQREEDIRQEQLSVPPSGFKVILKTTTGKQIAQTGHIDFRDYKINPSTGSFAMRASIDNSEQTLAPGQFVRVILQGGERLDTYVIPQRAVLDSPNGKYVYIAEKTDIGGYIAQRRPVTVGEWVELDKNLQGETTKAIEKAWIIKTGLKPNDQVVINGMARIYFPGMAIQPSAETKSETVKVESVNKEKNETSSKKEA